MAASLGLRRADVARLNRHYMLGVVDAVCADDQLTREERALVIQLAGLLDLADLEVEALLARAEGLVSRVVADVELKPGDLVVLTGMSEARKRELTAVAEARGLVVWPWCEEGCGGGDCSGPWERVGQGAEGSGVRDPGGGGRGARKATRRLTLA